MNRTRFTGRRLATGIATAAFVVTSAAAFAASPAPAGTAPAPAASAYAPAQTASTPSAKPIKVAQTSKLKACEKEWKTGEKGGKLNDMNRKAFLSSCVKGA
ncbi:hypothetical protein J2X65_000108 [Ancylobacter sp. 3268]|uniref:hypothetical protein n=1 Tax=Ancylobacter sp. 3268 TaxID=2817752 RepID=UPI00285D86D6|nr:hypothetical protein [Ancylobacter sp. 3268]MDR6950765.1 hypothetical protein [Ancylobacter sp. 3268]